MEFFDGEITAILQNTYDIGSKMDSPWTSDQLTMAITATNLKALVNGILLADTDEEIQINLKKLALCILGTVDFLERDLPTLGGE